MIDEEITHMIILLAFLDIKIQTLPIHIFKYFINKSLLRLQRLILMQIINGAMYLCLMHHQSKNKDSESLSATEYI